MISLLLVYGLVLVPAHGADWITAPSYYSHDPQTGERVTQYTPIGPVYTFARSDYRRSGYRHTRSSIQAGDSRDHMHIVEEWGRPIRPYGEWRYPYRPYSVPYPAWGSPFAGLGNPYYPGPYPYQGGRYPRPDDGPYPDEPAGGPPQKWLDDTYPDDYRDRPARDEGRGMSTEGRGMRGERRMKGEG